MKCPHCETNISTIRLDDVELVRDDGAQRSLRGYVYSCRECQSILSVQMNELTLQADLLTEIEKRLPR